MGDWGRLFEWYDVESDRIRDMPYGDRRAWLHALGVKVRVWAAYHEPRHDIEMNVDLSSWFDDADSPEGDTLPFLSTTASTHD